MLYAFLVLILLQLVGEAMREALGLPVPGMILGLLMLLGLLVWRGRRLGEQHAVPGELDAVARGLHAHLGLLFVPAGAGVLAQAEVLAVQGTAILAAVVLSAAVTLGVAALLALGAGERPGRLPLPADATAAEEVRQ